MKNILYSLGAFFMIISCSDKSSVKEPQKINSNVKTIVLFQSDPNINQIYGIESISFTGRKHADTENDEKKVVLKFDKLDGLTSKSVIDSAFLYITSFLDSGMNINGDNSFVLKKILGDNVKEDLYTWNNPPVVDLNKKVYVSKLEIKDKGVNKFNITGLIKSNNDDNLFDINVKKNGILMEMVNSDLPESVFNLRSGAEANGNKRPKIVVYYH